MAVSDAAPLAGIRVIEVAQWIAAPATGALLADLGADVIKVEPPGGDRYRGLLTGTGSASGQRAGGFELDNRGKRSITVDLDRPGGPDLIHHLCRDADIFLTNLIPSRRRRFGLRYEDLQEINPRAIYAAISGYGTRGPDADRLGFDKTAFFARTGLMSLTGEPGGPPVQGPGGTGDHTACLNLLAATLSALFLRERDGSGRYVEVSLYNTGIWTLGGVLQSVLASDYVPVRQDRVSPVNPLWNSYRTEDDAWILLVNPEAHHRWPAFSAAVGRERWAHDLRYDSMAKRSEHSREIVAELDAIFAQTPLEIWAERLDQAGIIWAPVALAQDVVSDEQAVASEVFVDLPHPELGKLRTLNTPFRIDGADVGPRHAAPAAGQDTQAVLQQSGFDDQAIAKLAADGLLG
jgi:crotonobetainyl-CoA:carnitine CoA-transferase CaiB-like acyl-CoA transferase